MASLRAQHTSRQAIAVQSEDLTSEDAEIIFRLLAEEQDLMSAEPQAEIGREANGRAVGGWRRYSNGWRRGTPTLDADAFVQLPRPSHESWIGETCSICLEALNADEDVREIPSCQHVFHCECLMPWVTERRASCPMCRLDVTV